MRKHLLVLGLAVAILALPVAAQSQGKRGATFTPIGHFPTCPPPGDPDGFCSDFPFTFPLDLSGDGSILVGQHALGNGVMRWTAELGVHTLGPMSGGVNISRDGATIVANTASEETWPTPEGDMTDIFAMASYWLGGTYPDESWFVLPQATAGMIGNWAPCGGSAQSQFGVSPDGQVITGLTWDDEDGNGNGCEGAKAFRWDASSGVTSILDNSLSGSGSNRSNATSQNGDVITGWSAPGRTASAWIDGVETYLCTGDEADWFCNEGWDVTPDGSTILFSGASPTDFNVRAALYHVATGEVEQLPFPDAFYDPQWDTFQGWAISDDGNTVVGEFGGGGFFGSPPYPVVWNRDLGVTLDLQVFLIGQGLDDLFFWFLSGANAVNSDGTIIAGDGNNPDGWIEGWVVDIAKVKVCHKPETQERTLSVGWEGVADHLGHGDALGTCEFVNADGHSRAIDSLRVSTAQQNDDPSRDARIPTLDDLNRRGGTVANPYPTDAENDEFSNGGQTSRQRESLNRRMGRQQQ